MPKLTNQTMHRAAGELALAGELLREALEIFQRIGGPEAGELRAGLDALGGPPESSRAGPPA